MMPEKYSNFYFSRDYYSNLILPIDIESGVRKAIYPVPFTQHDDMILIFVSSGKGKIVVNAKEFEARRGLFMCVCPFHYYMLAPDKGDPLVIHECRYSTGSSLYISACPYNSEKSLSMPYAPPSVYLDEENADKVEKLLRAVDPEKAKKAKNTTLDKRYLALLRLYGILLRERKLAKERRCANAPEPA